MRVDLNIAEIESGLCRANIIPVPAVFDDLIVTEGGYVYLFLDGRVLAVTLPRMVRGELA